MEGKFWNADARGRNSSSMSCKSTFDPLMGKYACARTNSSAGLKSL
jgi:hypothetical protein